MPMFTPEELARWSQGTWSGTPTRAIGGISHDTRTLESGALYVALEGNNVDGHDFIPVAADCGAGAALCRRGKATPSLPCLEVDDPLKGLQDLARGYRSKLGGIMIGITGSAGKTTVKELLADILAKRGDTCRTLGNWNNHIGLPLSMLSMERSDDFGVFEVGMNKPGEIADLTRTLQPIAGLITSIGAAHLQAFGSLEGIAREKGSLLAGLPRDGMALIDIDSPWKDLFISLTPARVVTCSLKGPADYMGQPSDNGKKLIIQERAKGFEYEVNLPLPGRHMMRNLMLALGMARESGVTPGEIQRGVQDFAPQPMRWEQKRVGPYHVINDAYNANPLSMRSAVRTFAEMSRPVEKWLLLGGMAELGEAEQDLHVELGEYISQYSFHGLVVVGEAGSWIAEKAGVTPCHRVQNLQQAAEVIREQAGNGAALLLKASRSVRMERILPLLAPEEQD